MKKFKATLAAFLAVCAMFNLAGCSENRGPDFDSADGSSINNPNSPNDGGSENTDSTEIIKTQYAPIMLTDSNTLNSIRLFDAVSADKTNAMFSPLSLNMALGLIEAGAQGDTKTALDSYLQTKNYADLAEKYMKLAQERYSFKNDYSNEKNVLEIANSFWADNKLPVKDEYKRRVGSKFDAEIKNLDFSNEGSAVNEINSWINKKTHEMIPSMLNDLDPNTAAVLINTVYFESAWSFGWSINRDNNESFTLADGTKKELPLMYNNSGYKYFENDHATAFGCDYSNGLTFVGILPKESGEFTLEGLDIPALLESESHEYDVSAVMPRLNFETEFDLKDALCAAGLENIFDGREADFSDISDADLWVSKILQKTKLELDENGTKAAAATVVEAIVKGIYIPKERKTVRLDRPFAFMIYDSAEDQILFVGKVTNP